MLELDLSIQCLAHLSGDRVRRKGLLEEGRPRVEHAVVHDGVARGAQLSVQK